MGKNRSVRWVGRGWGVRCSFKVGGPGQPHRKASLSKDVEEGREGTSRCLGRVFQAEATASAKALRWERNSRETRMVKVEVTWGFHSK